MSWRPGKPSLGSAKAERSRPAANAGVANRLIVAGFPDDVAEAVAMSLRFD